MSVTNVTRLHQVLAVLPDIKNRVKSVQDAAYKRIQGNQAPLNGLSRTYQPRDDQGEMMPPEQTLVQTRLPEIMGTVEDVLVDLLNIEFTAEQANTHAKASVKIGDETLLDEVPVTYLIFVEKVLTDLTAMLRKLPTLDPAEVWHWDDNSMAYATEPTKTTRTKKIPQRFVKYEATDKHPAQVEIYHEDQIVGDWTKTQFSGAIPGSMKVELVRRVETLRQAVKAARAEGNAAAVTQEKDLGKKVFDFVFAPLDAIGR